MLIERERRSELTFTESGGDLGEPRGDGAIRKSEVATETRKVKYRWWTAVNGLSEGEIGQEVGVESGELGATQINQDKRAGHHENTTKQSTVKASVVLEYFLLIVVSVSRTYYPVRTLVRNYV